MRSLGGLLASLGLLMCAAHAGDAKLATLELPVPERVAAQAAARAKGEASASPPILVLENVELPLDESLSISVHGPGKPGSTKPGPELGRASIVGSHTKDTGAKRHRMTLVVPLRDEALPLLAGKREVTLILKVADRTSRPMPPFERAFFDDGEPSNHPPGDSD